MKTITYFSLFFLPVFFFVGQTNIVTNIGTEKPFFSPRDSVFDYASFLDPPNEYRSHPFYSLNDQLQPEELARQVKGFKQAGFGGFYLHSRSGLITDYLSEDWWNLMGVAVDAANEVDIQCMFYDEDKWPSGFAGGLVPDLSEDYRAKCLARLDLTTKLPIGAKLLNKDSLYQYVLYTAQFGYDIFNGKCYVDLYNPNAVKAFIESTHRPYFEKYQDKIKENELFIFTDEPHIHSRYFDRNTKHQGLLSYSPYVEKKFQALYGYSLRNHLDQLFEEKGNWRVVRWHYHKAKALLFEESFTKQIADFCDQYGAQSTGHYLGEDDLKKVRDRIGNSSLHYRSMQQPGIDHLGLSTAHRLLTPKYLSSVANQYGKRMRLSELFGISGQNMDFQERKWIAGWHAVLGVNHFCPHLTAYSLKGARKRDYPPTFSYHQPYWPFNKIVEDYLGRISYAATIGVFDPQVLIISPLESEYIKSGSEGEFTSGILQIAETLQNQQIDYDLGDEEIIEESAAVKGPQFSVGYMDYKYVILPKMLTIRQNTLSLLLQFKKNGGTIFSVGELPQFVDAEKNTAQLSELRKAVVSFSPVEFNEKLRNFIQPALQITGDQSDQVWIQSRKVQEHPFYLIYNTSNTSEITVDMQLATGAENLVLWDPGKVKTYQLQPDKNGAFKLSLAPAGFYWITTGALSGNIATQKLNPQPKDLKPLVTLGSSWAGKRNDPNVLVLDFAAYSTDGGKTYSAAEPVIGIWSRLKDQAYDGDLRLKFFTTIKTIPTFAALAIEQPEAFQEISVNHNSIGFKGEDYFIDRSFKTQDVSRLLIKGRNEIDLKIHFSSPEPLSPEPIKRYETELESLYLIGDFGVYTDKVETFMDTQRNRSEDLTDRPAYAFTNYFIDGEKDLLSGNLVLEGYPFYAGSFTLNNSFEIKELDPAKNYFLDLSACDAIAIEVVINDQRVDTLSWAPYILDIKPYLKKGNNTIQLQLVNSLRNLLGPHHHQGGELIKVGPNSFTGAGGFPDGRGEANWYDLRKKENAELAIWTDTYYHIPFGLTGKVFISTN